MLTSNELKKQRRLLYIVFFLVAITFSVQNTAQAVSIAYYSSVQSYSSSVNGGSSNQIYINTSENTSSNSRYSRTELRIPVGQSMNLNARLGGAPLVFTSQTNSDVAKITGSGNTLKVKGLRLGTNTIKLCKSGSSQVCKFYSIKVVDKVALDNSIQKDIEKRMADIQKKIQSQINSQFNFN